ncbi:MAG: metallophosphoesterase [Saprospiraceae bacterium]
MKLIALGDTHGRPYWKDIVRYQVYDKIVFIGDYFDTKEEISAEEQISNFKEICAFKRTNPDKVILLLGNHDFHYLDWTSEIYTGFQRQYYDEISALLHEALANGLLRLCYSFENILFTHAGVSKTWCEANGIDMTNIESAINELFALDPGMFEFDPDPLLGEKMEAGISPIWVRPDRLKNDKPEDFIQVVGHTMQLRVRVIDDIVLIDTLGTSREYLLIEEGKVYVMKIKDDR